MFDAENRRCPGVLINCSSCFEVSERPVCFTWTQCWAPVLCKSPHMGSTHSLSFLQGRLTKTCHNSVASFCCGHRPLLGALNVLAVERMKWNGVNECAIANAPLFKFMIWDHIALHSAKSQSDLWLTHSGDDLAEPKWYFNGAAQTSDLESPSGASIQYNCLFTHPH